MRQAMGPLRASLTPLGAGDLTAPPSAVGGSVVAPGSTLPALVGLPEEAFSGSFWEDAALLVDSTCVDAIVVEPEHIPHVFEGPSVLLSVHTGIAGLVFDEEEKELVLAVSKPSLYIDVDPLTITKKRVSPLLYQTKSCAIEKVFGPQAEYLLYVFDKAVPFDALAMTKTIYANVVAAMEAERARYAFNGGVVGGPRVVDGVGLWENRHKLNFKAPFGEVMGGITTIPTIPTEQP